MLVLKIFQTHFKEVYINGSNKDVDLANAFAAQFSSVYCSSDDAADAKKELEALLSGTNNNDFSKEGFWELINVESVDRYMKTLKLGKALGPDGLNAEHLRYAYPIIAVHICALFPSIILHGYVPKDFESGFFIPLIKGKTGDVNIVINYRGITLIPVISKLFELNLLDMCEQFLGCYELQFGFKKGIGCSEAIFALRSTIDYL